MVKILVFDTETTGLPPEDNDSKLLSWPSIIQLGYILYDTNDPSNAKIFNKYIDLPDDIEITKESMKIHHISKETIALADDVNRAKIYDVLDEFIDDVAKADIIVGHNVQFDRNMIIVELTRVSKEHTIMNNANFACTMKIMKPICKLKISIKGVKKNKQPKLLEAYKHYFGHEPNKKYMHNALIDSVVCLRVYCMTLPNGFDVYNTNTIITNYINKISPRKRKTKQKKQKRKQNTRKSTVKK